MIHLKIETVGEDGVIYLDDKAQAFLGAAIDDVLVFDEGRITVQTATGQIGRTFIYEVAKAADTRDNTAPR